MSEMNETKSVFLSKGFMGGAFTFLIGLAMMFGLIQPNLVEVGPIEGVDPNVVGEVLRAAQVGGEVVVGVLTMAFGLLAMVGRIVGVKNLRLFILVIVCGLLFFAGCGGVRMSPPYARALEQSAITVGELNTRCQNGDDLACKGGLQVASETLNLIVDALHGKGAGDDE
jgi:hypothetical protein